LKLDNLKVKPREEQLKDLRENEFQEFLNKVNIVGEKIDLKVKNSSELLKSTYEEFDNKLKNKIQGYLENVINDQICRDDQIKEKERRQLDLLEEVNNLLEESYESKDDQFELTKKEFNNFELSSTI